MDGKTQRKRQFFYEMGSLFNGLLLCFWLFLLESQNTTALGNVIEGTVFINGTVPIAQTDENFICVTLDWWPPEKCDFGTCSWGNTSLLNLDLSNPLLLNSIKALSPLKIRLGGTLQNKLVFESEGGNQPCSQFVKNTSEMFDFSQGCLPRSRWDELNIFFKKAGADIFFGLNILYGKTIKSKESAVGAWDSSNAESLIRYTVKKGYRIFAWELGNELVGHFGVGTKITADEYASDVNSLQNIVQKIYKSFDEEQPLIMGPGGFYDTNWFTEFINKTSKSLQVVTHHIYNLGSGVERLIDKILNPSALNKRSDSFKGIQSILKSSATSAVAWVGEGGGAYNSGRNLVTNAFVFSFWYLDQLGLSASYDTKAYCRQSLIGGNYGLINTSTFLPNPDYYSALLWYRLMGRNVLKTNFSGTNKIRAYAHCSKTSQGITLLLLNLNRNTTVRANISTEFQQEQKPQTKKFATMSPDSETHEKIREEYHLTAKDGNLQSQTMLLNGKILELNSSGDFPPLEPIYVSMEDSITVAPLSIVFIDIPSIIVPACA